MKKILSFGVLAVLMLSSSVALAAEFRGGNQASTAAGETVLNDVYMGGGTVTSAGAIHGDLYAGGGTVLVSGEIWGDAVLGGGTVSILGKVGDDVRVGGGTVIVQGPVAGDVLAGGGSVQIAGEGVKGDVVAGGGTVRIDAPVGGGVRAGGGDIYLNSAITGNVQVQAQSLTLGKNAVITGNLNYKSPKEVVMEDGAKVVGKVSYEPQPIEQPKPAPVFVLGALIPLLMLIVGSLFFGLVFKRYMAMLVSKGYENPLRELGRGLIFLIVAPIISVILLITVVGIPLGILGLLGFIVMMIFTVLLAPVFLGSLLLKWTTKRAHNQVDWKSILLGAFAFYLLGWIPFVGWIAQFILILLTLGSIIYVKFSIAKEWR